jgi:BMFP domain-containing protein YqiC
MPRAPATPRSEKSLPKYSFDIFHPDADDSQYERPDLWLARKMRDQKLSNGDLEQKLHALGYAAATRGNIGAWRKGRHLIPMAAVPHVARALGHSELQVQLMTIAAYQQAFPALKDFIEDPVKRKASSVVSKLTLMKVQKEADQNAQVLKAIREKVAELEAKLNELKGMLA